MPCVLAQFGTGRHVFGTDSNAARLRRVDAATMRIHTATVDGRRVSCARAVSRAIADVEVRFGWCVPTNNRDFVSKESEIHQSLSISEYLPVGNIRYTVLIPIYDAYLLVFVRVWCF